MNAVAFVKCYSALRVHNLIRAYIAILHPAVPLLDDGVAVKGPSDRLVAAEFAVTAL